METEPEVILIPDRTRARRTASLCAIAVVVSHVIAYALYAVYWYFLREAGSDTQTGLDLIVNTCVSDLIALPLVWLLLLRRLPRNEALALNAPERTPLEMRSFLFYLPCVMAVMYGGSLTGKLVGALFGGFNDVIADLVSDVNPLATLLCAVIIAPVAEELFFRKALIDRLSLYHPMDAILLSGLLFGLMHGNLTQFLYAFPLGVLLGIIYWRTKNIRYTILLHVAINTLGGVLPSLVMQLQSVPTDTLTGMIGGVLYVLYLQMVLGLMVLGIVFLIKFRKRFLPVKSLLPRCRKPFYLNVGWFVACTVFVGMFIWIEFL